MIKFIAYGESTGQVRPSGLAKTRTEHRLYDPANSGKCKGYVRVVASQHRPDKLLEGPLQVSTSQCLRSSVRRS
jgi:Holliday junction resolvase RusA-like endonuclease